LRRHRYNSADYLIDSTARGYVELDRLAKHFTTPVDGWQVIRNLHMVEPIGKELNERLREATDKFQYVLELPELYRSAETYAKAVQTIQAVGKTITSYKDKTRIDLAVIYMNRARSDKTAANVLSEIQSMKTGTQRDQKLELLRRFVEGAVLLTKARDYSLSIRTLENVESRARKSEDHFLYSLVRKTLGDAYMYTGRHQVSELAFQDAMATFRRYDHRVLLAYTYNNYGVLKKKTCRYGEAEGLFNSANCMFRTLGVVSGEVLATINLGILFLKTGNWRNAELFFRKANELNKVVIPNDASAFRSDDSDYEIVGNINFEHLLILRRDFAEAELSLQNLLSRYGENGTTKRMVALAHEFLGELYRETGESEKAKVHLRKAFDIANDILPRSDLMTEIARRMAETELGNSDIGGLTDRLLTNIRLCRDIEDKLELGASLRVLGLVYAQTGKAKKSITCFEFAIRTLRAINECYELMRTCVDYGSVLTVWGHPDAEIYLLEAQQLCKKLELNYFLARVNVECARLETKKENFTTARDRLSEASRLCEQLHENDRLRVERWTGDAERELEQNILEKSVSGAEELRAICHVYEESHFPMEKMKPELAYQVAQNVNADSLFLIGRRGRGYTVPLAYNVPVNEAKEIVRRLDRDWKRPILGIDAVPKVLYAYTGQYLVCVPTKSELGVILCTTMPKTRTLSPRQLEFLLASADAITRLVREGADSPSPICDDFNVSVDERSTKHPRGSFKDILTVTTEMINLIRLAERASLSQETILLEGETGVGKELFANAIHANSGRRNSPFVAINAGGMPINLLESQLFGHVRGAFTDAVRDRTGLIEEADGGTIFLDEVGEMGPELQVKLLRLLENGEFRRLGENRVRIANVRVVSATNRDLLKELERGTFRRDLYYRLGTVRLHIPPLRFRPRDIELLIRHFLRQCAVRYGQPNRYFEIDVKAMEALELYDWPGNVRELQNEIRRIVSLIGDGDTIRFGMLSSSIKEYVKSKNRSASLLERDVERYERRLILSALNKNDWNRLRTAEDLGLPRTTLLAKMRRLNVAAR
jgi:DNA-binding NtrC family response regulator/tetratricopeptide (TPR) repeat protein